MATVRAAAHQLHSSFGAAESAASLPPAPPTALGLLGAHGSAWELGASADGGGGGRGGAGRGRPGSLSKQGTSARVLEAVSCLEVVERERGLHAEAVSGLCLAEDGTTICATSGTQLKVRSSCDLPRSPTISHDLRE